jgi:hypothetical protein
MGAPSTQSTRTRTQGFGRPGVSTANRGNRIEMLAQLRSLIRLPSVCICVLTRSCLSIPRQKRPAALGWRTPLALNPPSRSQLLPTCAKTHRSHQCLGSGLQFRALSGSRLPPVCTLRPAPKSSTITDPPPETLSHKFVRHPWSIHTCRRRAAEPPRGGCRHGAASPKTSFQKHYLVIEQVVLGEVGLHFDTANSGNE